MISAENAHQSNQSKFALLEALDIPLWGRRPVSDTGLFLLDPKRFARVLVVLSSKIVEKNTNAFQVFRGMLKVLDLNPEAISIAWLKNKIKSETNFASHATLIENPNVVPNIISIINTLNYWQPENVLIMGNSLGNMISNALNSEASEVSEESADSVVSKEHCPRYFITYHPQELVDSPSYKKEAYRVLLSIKATLDTGVINA